MKHTFSTNTKGSALILVLFAVLILSLIGISGLTQVGTDMSTERNFSMDKSTFFVADGGIQYGTSLMKNALEQSKVKFTSTLNNMTFYSGKIADGNEQYIKGFLEFPAPPPKGISIEISGELGAQNRPWSLPVTVTGPKNAKKELEAVIVTMVNEY